MARGARRGQGLARRGVRGLAVSAGELGKSFGGPPSPAAPGRPPASPPPGRSRSVPALPRLASRARAAQRSAAQRREPITSARAWPAACSRSRGGPAAGSQPRDGERGALPRALRGKGR